MSLDEAADQINSGGVAAFPTETVYGLGADARNRDAIKEVFRLKARPADNPLIVHIAETDQIREFASEVPDAAPKLANKFWPGPLTMVFSKKADVLDIVTGGLPTVALRMPDHPLALDLIRKTAPLVGPSANKSGRPSPTKAEHVTSDFGDDVIVLDGGSCKLGLESTVIRIEENRITILRPGHIDPTELEKASGLPVEYEKPKTDKPPESPGTKYSHYSPKAEVKLALNLPESFKPDTLYLIISEIEMDSELPDNVIVYDGNLRLMAEELYDRFRQADIHGYQNVVIVGLDTEDKSGLGRAVANRIEKAAGI